MAAGREARPCRGGKRGGHGGAWWQEPGKCEIVGVKALPARPTAGTESMHAFRPHRVGLKPRARPHCQTLSSAYAGKSVYKLCINMFTSSLQCCADPLPKAVAKPFIHGAHPTAHR
jgi:hypothetical protein